MESINKINKIKQTHKYREQTDDCHSGIGLGDGVKQVKGVGKKKKHLIETDICMVITGRKRGRGREKRINGG